MKPMAAAALGALISGVGMYAVTTRAMQTDPFANVPALVQTVDGRYVRVPNAETVPYGYVNSFQAATRPVVVQQRPATVYRTAAPVQERVVQDRVVERRAPRRSWAKTGMIIGGSTASGAGLGGLIGGKKGALVGAALGGGAASIYEASHR